MSQCVTFDMWIIFSHHSCHQISLRFPLMNNWTHRYCSMSDYHHSPTTKCLLDVPANYLSVWACRLLLFLFAFSRQCHHCLPEETSIMTVNIMHTRGDERRVVENSHEVGCFIISMFKSLNLYLQCLLTKISSFPLQPVKSVGTTV